MKRVLLGVFLLVVLAGATTISPPASILSFGGYAMTIDTRGSDADNRGLQITQSANGTTAFGLHILNNGAAANSYAIKIGCVNGTVCRALETSDGDVRLNTQSGNTIIKGATTVWGPTFTLGLSGSGNTKVVEKHATTPTITNCGTSGASVIGSDFAMTITVGIDATACTVNFTAPAFANPPTCGITPIRGAWFVLEPTLKTKFTLSEVDPAAKYAAFCVGH